MSLPQPVPPSWKDLGKSSNDLLGKDFPSGLTSLEVKTVTPSNVAFRAFGTKADHQTTINGLFEAKYTDRKNGLTVTQAWNNKNDLITDVEIDNKLADGLKIALSTTLLPNAGKGAGKAAILNSVYKMPGLHSRASIDLLNGPKVTADTVMGYDGFVFGTEASYNITTGALTNYAAAAGFSAPEYAVALFAHNKFQTYTASYYHRVSRDVEAGGKAIYDAARSADGVKLEVGTKAYLDSAAFVKAKINNAGILSLGYTQALRPGVKASFGLALDTQKLNGATPAGPAHKIGASFVFEG